MVACIALGEKEDLRMAVALRIVVAVTLLAVIAACGPAASPSPSSSITTWYLDADGDGWGDSTKTTQAVAAPSGYVDRGGDCNDAHGLSYPGADITEGDGAADNNCDGVDDGGSEP